MGMDSSSTNIKINSSPRYQPLSMGIIATFSFNAMNLDINSNTFLIITQLRACRRLKIPLNNLKVQWRVYEAE